MAWHDGVQNAYWHVKANWSTQKCKMIEVTAKVSPASVFGRDTHVRNQMFDQGVFLMEYRV